MRFHSFAASDRGKSRETNEDCYLTDESLGLYVVCDGMGGHAAGEVAAERSVAFAVDYIRERRAALEEASNTPNGYRRVLKLAEDATQEASRRLYGKACADPTCAGMGATMTMLLIVDNKAVMSHVGDSRLYLLRRGKLHQLSTDHTLANEMLHAGSLTQEEAAHSKYNHVLTRSIGQQKLVQVESLLFDLFPHDIFLLCSDGLSNYFGDRQSVTAYLESPDSRSIPDRLVEFANSRGGADNITVIVVRATSDTEEWENDEIQNRIDTLKSTFLCREFSTSRLMRVLNISSIVECAAGHELLSMAQSCDGLYVVLSGSLTIQDDPILSCDLTPGDCVGESSLLADNKSHASVVANETTRLIFISRSRFEKLVRRQPKLGNALLSNLGRHLSDRLEILRTNDDISLDDTGPLHPE